MKTLNTAITNFENAFKSVTCYDTFTSVEARTLVESFGVAMPKSDFCVDFISESGNKSSFCPFYVEDLNGKLNFRFDVMLDDGDDGRVVKRFEILQIGSTWNLTSLEYDIEDDSEITSYIQESAQLTFSAAIIHLVQLLKHENTDFNSILNVL